MSAKSSPTPEPSHKPAGGDATRVRRISNPRPRKTAKPATATGTEAAFVVQAPELPKFPEFPDSPASPAARGDWPEPEAATAEAPGPPEHAKRKRRRKKGKGHNPQIPVPATDEDASPLGSNEPAESAAAPAAPSSPPPPNHAPRAKIDPDVLATRAWKIYLSEVSEEGVALIGDTDAKELARRCFKLAEIFIEEQARRR